MADFPGAIFEPREVENLPGIVYDAAKTKTLFAEDVNLATGEIVAIEETLGENPQGDFANVTSRIQDLERYTFQLLIQNYLGSAIKAGTWGKALIDVTNTFSLLDGSVHIVPIFIRNAITLTGVKWYQSTQGAYTADNYNGVGLFSYSGGTLTLVASSTDDGNIWKATADTLASKAFSSTYAATRGVYYAALLYNTSAETTAPTIGALPNFSNTALLFADFANSAVAAGRKNSQTALPSPVAISTFTARQNLPALFVY